MTRRTFYKKLRAVKNRFYWKLEGGDLRAKAKSKACKYNGYDFCPITALYYAETGNSRPSGTFDVCARLMGMEDDDASFVVDLADNMIDKESFGQRTARLNLIKSVGVKIPVATKGI